VVGAQRPASALASDAPMNLRNAVRLAAATEARGMGVLTLLNDEVQAAREVTKTSTYRLETFRAPELGMLGFVDPDGKVAIYRRPTRRHAPHTEFDVRGRRALPQVEIVYCYAGAGRERIDAAVGAGAAGIVVASLAPGIVAVSASRRPTACLPRTLSSPCGQTAASIRPTACFGGKPGSPSWNIINPGPEQQIVTQCPMQRIHLKRGDVFVHIGAAAAGTARLWKEIPSACFKT
jgi:hypothetical protein